MQGKVMSWLHLQTTLFCCPCKNYGRTRTYRQVLFSDFAIDHEWSIEFPPKSRQYIDGYSNDLETIIDIRRGLPDKEKGLRKQTLQCFTPAACLKSKKKGQVKIIHINPILQLDFDELENFDINEVKRKIFSLPYVCYVGLSVSGKLFALLLIAEPDKLKQYAEHCFAAFEYYGLPVDTTKGRNYTDLRYVSYDHSPLFREDPIPLHIKKFYKKPEAPRGYFSTQPITGDMLTAWAIKQVRNAEIGNRFKTVRRVAYTMGGAGFGLQEVIDTIKYSPQYNGVEEKYITHAEEGFAAGQLKPLTANGNV